MEPLPPRCTRFVVEGLRNPALGFPSFALRSFHRQWVVYIALGFSTAAVSCPGRCGVVVSSRRLLVLRHVGMESPPLPHAAMRFACLDPCDETCANLLPEA